MSQQCSENQEAKHVSILDFFRNATKEKAATARAYQAAAVSFCNFATAFGINVENLTESDTYNWVAYMWANGIKPSTSAHYLNILASLYSLAFREGLIDTKPAFSVIRKAIQSQVSAMPLPDIRSVSEKLHRFFHKKASGSAETIMYEDILRILLIEPDMSLADVATLTRDTQLSYSNEIVTHYAENRRKYVFPLKQSTLTKLQLIRKVSSELRDIMASNGLNIRDGNVPVSEIIAALRFITALRCGARATDAMAATGCGIFRLPGVYVNAATDVTRRDATNRMIAEYLNDNHSRWYAMRMRHGIDYESITTRLEICRKEIPVPELFYPCQEIARRIGRRLVYREHPLISDVVFFRSRPSDITLLFSKIGDLAWCYSTRQSDGTFVYSAISKLEMESFQNTIGIFTPDVNIYPLGTLAPEEGEPVIVLGGPLVGRTGHFDSVVNDKDGSVLYRLILPGNNGIEWRAAIRPKLVKQLSKRPVQSDSF